MNESSVNYKTGIVLSGGAVRGFAHLGALKALHEANIYPDIISAVSAGSIAGIFYADGYEPEEIKEILEERKFYELVNLIFKNAGLLNISGLRTMLKKYIRAKTFSDLKKPIYVALTNIETGVSKYFNEGKIIDKVLASSSIPVIFKPIKINGTQYVDGGLTNNLPLEPIKDKCNKLIGINVNPLEENPKLKTIKDIAIRSFHISISANINSKKEKFDLYIEPKELKEYGYFNVSEGEEIFQIGYKEAKRKLSVIGNSFNS